MNFISLQLRASTSAIVASASALADSAKPLAKQSLHRLDPGTVIRNRDLLTEALPHSGQVHVAHDSLLVLVAASRQDTPDRLHFLRGGDCERGSDA